MRRTGVAELAVLLFCCVGCDQVLPGLQPSTDPTPTESVRDFVFPAPGSVFLQTSEGRFLVSRDDGATWNEVARSDDSQPAGTHLDIGGLQAGANGAVWGWWSTEPLGDTGHSEWGVAVMRAGDAAFTLIRFVEGCRMSVPSLLVPVPGDDPLFVDATGIQFWRKLPNSVDTCDSFDKVGVPTPDSSISVALFCGGRLFAIPVLRVGLEVHIWSSDDLGVTWTSEAQSFGFVARPVCGDAHSVAWVMLDSLVLRRVEESGSWTGVAPLVDLDGQAVHSASVAAVGDQLYIASTRADGERFLKRVGTDTVTGEGLTEELPLVEPESGYRQQLRTDSSDRLWVGGLGLHRYDTTTGVWSQVWPSAAP